MFSLLLLAAVVSSGAGGLNPVSQTGAMIGSAVGDIDMIGFKLTLDADKDTYLYSSADNIFDLFANGALYFQLTTTNATLDVNAVFDDCGTDCNSYSLSMSADNSTTKQEAKLQVMYGADPYLRLSAPNDSGTATTVLDIHDTSITYGNGAAGIDYVINFDGENNDGSLTYDEDNDRFTFGETLQTSGQVWVAGTNIKMSSGANGNLLITDSAGTAFDALAFGGVSSSYPSILRSGNFFKFMKADESDYTYTEAKRYVGQTSYGASFSLQMNSQVVVCSDSSTIVTPTIINAGAWLFGVSTRIIAALTGSTTGFKVGDGIDDDIFGVQTSTALGATTDNSNRTAVFSNPFAADQGITITFVNPNCATGSIVVVTYILYMTAPTKSTP